MTNEECRTALKRIAGYMCARKDLEALTHAMNVLEHISSGLAKNSKELEKDFGELDCISRKRAIERLKQNLPISDGADNSRDRHRYMQSLADIQAIRELPSVTPQEQRWIPVSERLPKAGESVGGIAKYYLVQNEYGDMLVARYIHSKYWEEIYQLKPIADEIIAWRELPQPYKAETEDT